MTKPTTLPTLTCGPSRHRRARRGFSLVELMVAVGAVLLLTVGIGQIFTSVSRLVGTGSAVAEVEQLARAIEKQMRDDFEGLGRMREEDTFLAIRSRRIGNIDPSDGLTGFNINSPEFARERPIYLTPEDRDADLRNGVSAYEEGSRAVTRRLDEIIFLAAGAVGGVYDTFQLSCGECPGNPIRPCDNNVSAPVVRIYYGHGLRPARDLLYDPTDTSQSRTPPRQWTPDGDFGQGPGESNRYDPGNTVNGGVVQGRNEYAADWPLLRQPMLLFGGLAAGHAQNSGSCSIICPDRAYAPYIRDLETSFRFLIYDDNARTGESWLTTLAFNPLRDSRPRLIRHGRTDICAQSPEDVKRWLEGEDLGLTNPVPTVDATPFRGGRWDGVSTSGPFRFIDDELWTVRAPGPGGNFPGAVGLGIRGAIAGIFTRMLCETEPPHPNRGDPNNNESSCEAIMDSHAVLTAYCSNFEVAWSDGITWPNREVAMGNPAPQGVGFDIDGDDIADASVEYGDLPWYDWLVPRRVFSGFYQNQGYSRYTSSNLDPEVLSNFVGHLDRLGNPVFQYGGNERMNRLTPLPPGGTPNPGVGYVWYDWTGTGGVDTEYLAIFPFREPAADLNENTFTDTPYRKPQFIRIRMTLHDSQKRLAEGKEFEFVFRLRFSD